MPWKEPADRHSESLLAAIEQASHRIATAITQGFAHMADAQSTALADLSTAINNIADAIAAEIGALQNAINAGATQQPNDSAAIEGQVTKLTQLTAALKAPLSSTVPVASGSVPVVTSVLPTSGLAIGGTAVSLVGSGLTGATGVTVGGVSATSLNVSSDTGMTFLTPAGTVGPAAVVVTTPAGVSGNSTMFTYN